MWEFEYLKTLLSDNASRPPITTTKPFRGSVFFPRFVTASLCVERRMVGVQPRTSGAGAGATSVRERSAMFQSSATSSSDRFMQQNPRLRRAVAWAVVLTTIAIGGLSAAAQGTQGPAPAAQNQQPYSEADVQFMSGMIPHHAQAVLIAGWAPSHGARSGPEASSASGSWSPSATRSR